MKRCIPVLFLLILVLITFAGCSEKQAGTSGNWRTSHDGCSGKLTYDAAKDDLSGYVYCPDKEYMIVLKTAFAEQMQGCMVWNAEFSSDGGRADCLITLEKNFHLEWRSPSFGQEQWHGTVYDQSGPHSDLDITISSRDRATTTLSISCNGELLFDQPKNGSGHLSCSNGRKLGLAFQTNFNPGKSIRCNLHAPIASETSGEGMLTCTNGQQAYLTWKGDASGIGTGEVIDKDNRHYEIAFHWIDE